MKKKQFILVALLALLMGTAQLNETRAQVFIMEEDDHAAPRATGTSFPIPDVPWDHDSTLDYTPVGSGIWVLGCLGAAYLIGKRRKEEK